MDGASVRKFFHELFGSRLAARLDEEFMRARGDFERQLDDKDREIARLRADLTDQRGKLDRYEMYIIPLISPARDILSPRKPPTMEPSLEPNTWQELQARHNAEQEAEAQAERLEKQNGKV